jgi:hypothetical protein
VPYRPVSTDRSPAQARCIGQNRLRTGSALSGVRAGGGLRRDRETSERIEGIMVSLTFASWNQIHEWLRRLDTVAARGLSAGAPVPLYPSENASFRPIKGSASST